MYYIVETDKSFDQASAALELAVKRNSFGILHVVKEVEEQTVRMVDEAKICIFG